jgi:GT2 family glycosyltransferase
LQYGTAEGRRPSPLRIRTTLNVENATLQNLNLGLSRVLRPFAVAIGIVTYNNDGKDLKRCVESTQIALRALQSSCAKSAILVIDNGEPSESALYENERVMRMESRGNIGFGAAHNILMAQAFDDGADYYVAANPDGAFHPTCLKALVEMSQAADDRAIVEALQFPDEHPKTYDPVTFVTSWASGACLFLPRTVYNDTGGFDDRFFMYCEDVDISWRAREAGYEVKTCPRAIFFHPVIDRPFDLEAHRRLVCSGILLARKWGSLRFESGLHAEAKLAGLDLQSIPQIKAVTSKGAANFGHLFSFSETRW